MCVVIGEFDTFFRDLTPLARKRYAEAFQPNFLVDVVWRVVDKQSVFVSKIVSQ